MLVGLLGLLAQIAELPAAGAKAETTGMDVEGEEKNADEKAPAKVMLVVLSPVTMQKSKPSLPRPRPPFHHYHHHGHHHNLCWYRCTHNY